MRSTVSADSALAEGASGERPLSANVRWTLLGSAAVSGGNWLLIVILARSGGPMAVGTYAYVLALTAPVMTFAGLQLRNLLAADPKHRYAFAEYRRLNSLTTVAGILVCGIVGAAGRAEWGVLVPVCAMRAADAVADIHYGLWQQRERMQVIGWSRLLQAVASVALVVVASIAGTGVMGAATGAALGSILALVFVRARVSSDPELRAWMPGARAEHAWRRLGRLTVEAFPLGVILLLGALQVNVPRYFVELYRGKSALGIFAATSQLTMSANMIVASVGFAALPRLASCCAAGDTGAFRRLALKLVALGSLLGAGGVAFSALLGRPVLIIAYGLDFASGQPLLVVLSLAAGMWFVAAFLGYALTAARVISLQPAIIGATLVVLVGCGPTLVRPYGAMGAAWSLVVAYAVQVLASWMALRRFMRRPPRPQLP